MAIPANEIDQIFDDEAVWELASDAGIRSFPSDFPFATFAKVVRQAARAFIEVREEATDRQVRDEIQALAKACEQAVLRGHDDSFAKLLAVYESISEPARRHLLFRYAHRALPNSLDLLDPRTREDDARLMHGLCVDRLEWKPGRKRPGGKRSRDTLEENAYAGPPARRGRPPDMAQYLLCCELADAYMNATGKEVSRGNYFTDKSPSPFVGLVTGVLYLLEPDQRKDYADHVVRRFLDDLNDTD